MSFSTGPEGKEVRKTDEKEVGSTKGKERQRDLTCTQPNVDDKQGTTAYFCVYLFSISTIFVSAVYGKRSAELWKCYAAE